MPSVTKRAQPPAQWRSLEEWENSPTFRAFVETEFPELRKASAPTRRQFLKVMGASLALGGLTACRWPREAILPHSRRPPGRTPGTPVFYATTRELGGVGSGVVVKSYDGRPIKVEGNDLHPLSHGATDAFAQASILDMYDPDRSRTPVQRSGGRAVESTWEKFAAHAFESGTSLGGSGGAGLRVLSEASSSRVLADARTHLLAKFPGAKWYEYEPVSRDNEREGTRLAFGAPHRTNLRLDHADVIVSFDDDFLLGHPASVRYTRDFAAGRTGAHGRMSRLYVFEGALSLTGSNADVRFAVRPSALPRRLAQLAAALAAEGVAIGGGLPGGAEVSEAMREVAKDIAARPDRAVITVGPRLAPEAHLLAAAINAALGAGGKTVEYFAEPDADRPSHLAAIDALAAEMRQGGVQTLVILGGNPAFDAPAELGFADLLAKVPDSVHLSLYENETSALCNWHVNRAHFLEEWGDARSWDGTVSLVQPLIEPMFGGRTPAQVVLAYCDEHALSAYDLTRAVFAAQSGAGADVESAWRRALHDGIVADTAWRPASPQLREEAVGAAAGRLGAAEAASGFEVVFAADRKIYDGRFANNAWLQETPDPLTKITWDNAAVISPADARTLGVRTNDKLTVKVGDTSVTLPAYVLPGQAPGVVTLALGYGRRRGGAVADGSGFDTYALRTAAVWNGAAGASVTVAGGSYELAVTQDHHAITSELGQKEIQRRAPDLAREGTYAEFVRDPKGFAYHGHVIPLVQLYAEHKFPEHHHWGMAIDLSKCTGCSACVVACQAENNVPVVGKDEVIVGREMHWLRIDRYFIGADPANAEAIRVAHQPIVCQHCENAPCETVCPVAATVHDSDGLNVMVYNRCIGTRYCSNNCPYKVRRFNWFYNHHGPAHPRSRRGGTPPYPGTPPQKKLTAVEMMAKNPEVTVRSRGVMEKCTFCVQRITQAKIDSRNAEVSAGGDWVIPDGSIETACQQACPADAITFGDLNPKAGETVVRRQHADPRSYEMLQELNLKTRNRYLARIRNPLHAPAAGHDPHAAPAGASHGTEAH